MIELEINFFFSNLELTWIYVAFLIGYSIEENPNNMCWWWIGITKQQRYFMSATNTNHMYKNRLIDVGP